MACEHHRGCGGVPSGNRHDYFGLDDSTLQRRLRPGAGLSALWLGIALTVCSIPVIITDLRTTERSEKLFQPETWKCLKVLILIVTVFLALPAFGFSAGLALITGGGMRLMGKRSWVSCVVTVIGTAVCIHYLFGQWLSIPLPKGMIGW